MRNKYDIVIVGSGIAGMYAALNIDSRLSVLLAAKGEIGLSNSVLAQGGVAAVLDAGDDSFELHMKDTMIAGGTENDPDAVRTLVEEGPSDVSRLMELGVEFDRDRDNRLDKTLEGGHSRRRVFHHRDQTGLAIMECLSGHVKACGNIDVMENTPVYSVTKIDNGFCIEFICGDKPYKVFTSALILATGGIGQVYRYTTNSAIATGDGIRFAYELGAETRNLSGIQFHPTAFAGASSRERFLISESVRGEGAYLLNCKRERFMDMYDERLELAPRDIVSKSIILESRKTGSDKFYLDITHREPEYLRNRFPLIYSKCLENGIDITSDLIPVFPCQHYLMGGIHTDLNAFTGVEGLYAAGECAHTGVHGRNRLASNSLLEALVFGRRAAISSMADTQFGTMNCSNSRESYHVGDMVPAAFVDEIRNIMQKCYFVIPDRDQVQAGIQRIDEILEELKTGGYMTSKEYTEALSIATVASLTLKEVGRG